MSFKESFELINTFLVGWFGGYKKNVRILSSLKYDGVLNYERIVEDLEKRKSSLQCDY